MKQTVEYQTYTKEDMKFQEYYDWFGVDLGTTYSCGAIVNRNATGCLDAYVLDVLGDRTVPSIVYIN